MAPIPIAATQNPPMLYVAGLPEAEQEATFFVGIWLRDLHDYVDAFACALYIFDEYNERTIAAPKDSRPTDVPRGVVFVAARDGALSIYHLDAAMTEITKSFKHCPILKQHVHHETLRAAKKRLKEICPGLTTSHPKLRHAIAHAGTENKKLIDATTSGVPLGLPQIVQRGTLRCRHYTTTVLTRDGPQNLSYELSQATLDRLRDITNQYTGAFIDAAKHMAALSPKKKESSEPEPPRT